MAIRDIKPGDRVEGVFILDAVEIKEGPTGPYLALSLRDRTGQIRAVLWERAQEASASLKGRDFVRVEGVATDFRGAVNVKVSAVEPLSVEDVSLEDLLEVVPEGVETWHCRLIEAISNIKDRHCQDIVDSFIYDETFMEIFLRVPAGVSIHHNYIGGLLEHTTNVMSMAIFASLLYPERLNQDILITGAFLHDVGKCRELGGGIKREYTREGRFIGHISLGVSLIEERLARLPHFPSELAVSLKHMVLSHHGELEFGSPVRPATPEALMLHYLDGLDAKLNHILRIIEKAGETDKRPYSRALGTSVQREDYVSQIQERTIRAPYEMPWEYDPMYMYLRLLARARLLEQMRWVTLERGLCCPSCGKIYSFYKTMKSHDRVRLEMTTRCEACGKWGDAMIVNRLPHRKNGNGDNAE